MPERTLVLIKPDAVKRGLCGEIILRFERRSFKIAGLKLLQLSEIEAKKHYHEHQGKNFFSQLIKFITSGPIVAMVLVGENAVQIVRSMIGLTNPLHALPGTIRGDFALLTAENVIHGSDSIDSAAREIQLFFSKEELLQCKEDE